MSQQKYDALVVGSGPAGTFAVKELTEQGLNVLLLEAGPDVGPEAFDPNRRKPPQSDINIWERARATLRGKPVQARSAFFSEKLEHLHVSDRKNPYTTDPDAPFLWIRGKQSGGRQHLFGRCLMRWSDDDFKINSRRGRGQDWPVSYADVEPYYDEVETFLELYGLQEHVPTQPDPKPVHAAQLTDAEKQFKAEYEAKWSDRNVIAWRYIAPEPERRPKALRTAMATGNLTIRYNSIVKRVLTDDATGKATGVEVLDANSRRVETFEASAVVLCASTVETVRLMMMSASARHPDGLGNSSGTLGRYFMDQLPCLAMGSYTKATGWQQDTAAPEDPFYPPSGGIFLTRSVGADGEATSRSQYQGSIGRGPVPDDVNSRTSFFGFGEMMPHADNRVTLDPRKTDAWGLPVPHIRCKIQPEDDETLRLQEENLLNVAEEMGLDLEFMGSPRGLKELGRGAYPDADPFSRFIFRKWFSKTMLMGAAIHETGGARMGDDPQKSVLNSMNQSWDVPNLFVTDGSAFAGSGVSGATLTLMALTVRACRHLAAELKAGRL